MGSQTSKNTRVSAVSDSRASLLFLGEKDKHPALEIERTNSGRASNERKKALASTKNDQIEESGKRERLRA